MAQVISSISNLATYDDPVGLEFELQLVDDGVPLPDIASLQVGSILKFQPPVSAEFDRPLTIKDAALALVRYITVAGDLLFDVEEDWVAQAFLITDTFKGHSVPFQFKIKQPLTG